jgi:hypothetical protein
MTRAWLLRRLVGDGRRHGAVWLALAVAFAVVTLAAAGARLVGRAPAGPAPAAARVIAYLDEGQEGAGAGAGARAEELRRVLERMPGVEAVRVVSARDGLELLRRELGARAGVLEGVGPDLLSPSLEIAARPAVAGALAIRLRRLAGVGAVDLVEAAEAPAAPADDGRAARLGVALAGTLGLLALVAALAVLRARLRVELALWLSFGLTRAASVRPALWLATSAGVVGAGAGALGASWAANAWLPAGALPARELALGAAAVVMLALAVSRVALRIPEAAGAR